MLGLLSVKKMQHKSCLSDLLLLIIKYANKTEANSYTSFRRQLTVMSSEPPGVFPFIPPPCTAHWNLDSSYMLHWTIFLLQYFSHYIPAAYSNVCYGCNLAFGRQELDLICLCNSNIDLTPIFFYTLFACLELVFQLWITIMIFLITPKSAF